MDSTSTYYAVGLISLIVATLLFIMYINIINMDLATDEVPEDRRSGDTSVEYVQTSSHGRDRDRNRAYPGRQERLKKKNSRDPVKNLIDESRDYDWDYDERHAKEVEAANNEIEDDDSKNPLDDPYSPETIAMRREQGKKQEEVYKNRSRDETKSKSKPSEYVKSAEGFVPAANDLKIKQKLPNLL